MTPNALALDLSVPASPLSPPSALAGGDVVAAAERFSRDLAEVDRRLRRRRDTLPGPEHRREVAAAFWSFVAELERAHEGREVGADEVRACREIAGRWLFRSRFWNRAFTKPHGYAGDFIAIEWLYDLETDPCADPVQPAVVNCLDHLLTTVSSVVSVWERRHFFAGLLRSEHERRGGRLRVLDVAGGGARYLRDYLEGVEAGADVRLTVLDQDPAARAYCRTRSLTPWLDRVELLCAPIRELPTLLAGQRFDVIISAGLFDYLDEPTARGLLTAMAARLSPGGIIALSNFHREDESRLIKDWLCDWPLIYRDEREGARLFPAELEVGTRRSPNGSLLYLTGRSAATPSP